MLTIGHSSLPLEMLIEILNRHGVRVVVDVRTKPRSRHNPQYCRESLSAALEERGIRYRWMVGLGGLQRPTSSPAPAQSTNDGLPGRRMRAFADYMQTPDFGRALAELLALEEGPAAALLGSPATPARCHRTLLADALTARSVAVGHILYSKKLGSSEIQPHRMSPLARVCGTGIYYPRVPLER